jgi:hypothetical protein
MTRSSGQLPLPVSETHTHFSDQIVDPDTREPYDVKAEVDEAKTLPESGVQQVRLLRVTVTHDEADISGFGFPIADVVAGAYIVSASLVLREVWSAPGTTLGLYLGDPETDNWSVTTWAVDQGADAGTYPYWTVYNGSFEYGVARTDTQLFVWSNEVGTSGVADLFILIAEPAS